MPSQLDFQQIMQAIFNEETGRIDTSSKIDSHTFNIIDKSKMITTDTQIVIEANEDRHYLLIQNGSKKRIWINFNEPATQGYPSVLLPAQATLIYENNNLYIGSLSAISDFNNIPLIIKEG